MFSVCFLCVFVVSLRKCVGCHLSHGLAQKEAGQCNHTCSPLVSYMDDVSGNAGVTNRNGCKCSFICLQLCVQ